MRNLSKAIDDTVEFMRDAIGAEPPYDTDLHRLQFIRNVLETAGDLSRDESREFGRVVDDLLKDHLSLDRYHDIAP